MVTIYYAGGRTRNLIKSAVGDRTWNAAERIHVRRPKDAPKSADFVVTSSGINTKNSMYAMRLGVAVPIVLPEGAAHLAEKLIEMVADAPWAPGVVIVAADVDEVTV